MKRIIISLNNLIFPFRKLWWKITKPKITGVKIIIKFNSEILLVRHSYGRGDWGFPGGRLEKEEEPISGARREIREELGINLENIDYYGSFFYQTPIPHKIFVCESETKSKNFSAENYEILEAKWFNIKNLPANCSPTVEICLKLVGVKN